MDDLRKVCDCGWVELNWSCWGCCFGEYGVALIGEKTLVGVGMMLRNHEGLAVGATAQVLQAGFDSSVAEATAMIESDSLNVISAVNSIKILLSDLGLVIGDIQSSLVRIVTPMGDVSDEVGV
ncbi:hypothetical protein ACOSQ2_014888 [Xanthoceras sorbifolium]